MFKTHLHRTSRSHLRWINSFNKWSGITPLLRDNQTNCRCTRQVARKWHTLCESLTALWLDGINITSIDAGIMKALSSVRLLISLKNSITNFLNPIQYLIGRSWKCAIAFAKKHLESRFHLSWVVFVWQAVVNATYSIPANVTWMALHPMSEYILSPAFNSSCCPMFWFDHSLVLTESTWFVCQHSSRMLNCH